MDSILKNIIRHDKQDGLDTFDIFQNQYTTTLPQVDEVFRVSSGNLKYFILYIVLILSNINT